MVNCLPQPYSKNTTRADNIQLLYVYCFAMYNARTEVTTVTDNQDGTVRILVENVNPCGHREFVSDKLFKKCIQGQVYRSAQNDCKGTGSVADYYGAQKFQWCSTKDGACLTADRSVDVNKSPAAISCDKDTMGGQKWKIFDSYKTTQASIDNYRKREEIPNDIFWLDTPTIYLGTSLAVYLSDIDTLRNVDVTSYQYLLCYRLLRI